MKKIFSLAIFALAISTSGFASQSTQTPIDALEALVQGYNAAKPLYHQIVDGQKAGMDDAFMNPNNFVSQIKADYIDRFMGLNALAYHISSNFDEDIPTIARNKIERRQEALKDIKAIHKDATTSKGWVYNSSKKMTAQDRASITQAVKESFGVEYTRKLEDAKTLNEFQDELEAFEKRVKEETKPSFIDREVQNAYKAAIEKDQHQIQWNHAFKGYEVVDTFIRNGREFGGFILYNKNTNDMIVVVPGTKSSRDWVKNVQAWGQKGNAVTGTVLGLNTHKGFSNAYQESIGSIKAAFNTFLEKNMSNIKSSKNPFTCHVTGHSLGAAIATILAYDFGDNLFPKKNIKADIKLVTVASPRLFDEKSAQKVEEVLGRGNMLRVYNVHDIVPKVIPKWYNSAHVGADFPVQDSFWDEAYMGPTVVNHFMSRYAHLIADAFKELKANIEIRKIVESFDAQYKQAHKDAIAYEREHGAHDKQVEQMRADASDSDSDSDSEYYDAKRKDLRSESAGLRKEAADLIKKAKATKNRKEKKQYADQAKALVEKADEIDQKAMLASIDFGHAQNIEYIEDQEFDAFAEGLGVGIKAGKPFADAEYEQDMIEAF